MNICFVHAVFPGGGAERVTRDIARGIMFQANPGEYSFYIYTPIIRDELMTEEWGQWFAGISNYSLANEEQELERLIKRDKIDIVVQITRRLVGIDRLKAKFGCKVIFADHGEPFYWRYVLPELKELRTKHPNWWKYVQKPIYTKLGFAKHKAKRLCLKDYRMCDLYTCLCEDYKYQIAKGLGIKPDAAHIVAINNSETPVDDVCYTKDKIVLFAGRFERFSKRVDRLIRIWAKAYKQLPDWKLILAGDGTELPAIKQMVADMKLPNVEFVGFQEDMTPLYRRASILCLTSQTEGWGLCLTEAQANGVIPIAFACTAAVKYILSPSGENGFLVKGFNENKFAKVLVSVAQSDPEHLLKLRQNVVKKAKDYSPEKIAAQWRKVFDDLMA